LAGFVRRRRSRTVTFDIPRQRRASPPAPHHVFRSRWHGPARPCRLTCRPASSSRRDQSPHTAKPTPHLDSDSPSSYPPQQSPQTWNKVPKRNPISKAHAVVHRRPRSIWSFPPRDRAAFYTDRNMPKASSIPRSFKPKILCTGIRIHLLSISTRGTDHTTRIRSNLSLGLSKFWRTSSACLTILSHVWFILLHSVRVKKSDLVCGVRPFFYPYPLFIITFRTGRLRLTCDFQGIVLWVYRYRRNKHLFFMSVESLNHSTNDLAVIYISGGRFTAFLRIITHARTLSWPLSDSRPRRGVGEMSIQSRGYGCVTGLICVSSGNQTQSFPCFHPDCRSLYGVRRKETGKNLIHGSRPSTSPSTTTLCTHRRRLLVRELRQINRA
jgi:hypothetical protein